MKLEQNTGPDMNKKYERISHGFGPLYNERSRVLILGSFPSVKSREECFFYGHPRNRFWKVMALVTDEEEPITIEEKKEMMLAHGIALYDVIESCDIIGSSDSSIRNVEPADLSTLIRDSDIKAVFTNGALAKKMYDKYEFQSTGIPSEGLPSTSPANASYNIEKLMEKWTKIKAYILKNSL